MKIAVILNPAPLDISCDVDEHGYIRKQKLVNVLSDSDLNVVQTANTLADEVDVFTVGKNGNENLLRLALAYGAHNGCHIGDHDWPENPRIDLTAQAVFLALKDEYPLVMLADNGGPCRGNQICAYLAKALNLPAFTSVAGVEKEGDGFRLLRKLEKGQRQVIKAGLPALIALLYAQNWAGPPALAQQIKAQESSLSVRRISYYGLLRQAARPAGINISWQPLPLSPNPQEVYHPLSSFHPQKRLEQLLQGSSASRKANKVSGTPQECAAGIVTFLLEKNLIKAKK